MRLSNEEIRQYANIQSISDIVRSMRWKWIGHVLRVERNYIARVALTWTPEGRRKVGRLKENWKRTGETERNQLGYRTGADAGVAAQHRGLIWKKRDASGSILHQKTRK